MYRLNKPIFAIHGGTWVSLHRKEEKWSGEEGGGKPSKR
jgi:hypothetical protein